MYEVVKTAEQQAIFNSIWEEAWLEEGYELEYTKNPLVQVLVKQDDEYVGTLEFKRLISSETRQVFDFEISDEVREGLESVIEIDKMTVRNGFRSMETLKAVILEIGEVVVDFEIPYLVALAEPRLFASLRRRFRQNVKRMGESFYYKGDDVVPMFLDCRHLIAEKAVNSEMAKQEVI